MNALLQFVFFLSFFFWFFPLSFIPRALALTPRDSGFSGLVFLLRRESTFLERERPRDDLRPTVTNDFATRYRDDVFVVPRYYSHNFSEPRSRRGEITYKRGSTDSGDVCVQWPSTCTRAPRAPPFARVTLITRNETDLSLAHASEIRGILSRNNEELPVPTDGTLIRDMYYFLHTLITVD